MLPTRPLSLFAVLAATASLALTAHAQTWSTYTTKDKTLSFSAWAPPKYEGRSLDILGQGPHPYANIEEDNDGGKGTPDARCKAWLARKMEYEKPDPKLDPKVSGRVVLSPVNAISLGVAKGYTQKSTKFIGGVSMYKQVIVVATPAHLYEINISSSVHPAGDSNVAEATRFWNR